MLTFVEWLLSTKFIYFSQNSLRTGAQRECIPYLGITMSGSMRIKCRNFHFQSLCFPLTGNPTSFIFKWFAFLISTAKHFSKKNLHTTKNLHDLTKNTPQKLLKFPWSFFFSPMVTVDINVLFFICFVSPRSAGFQQGTKVSPTDPPSLTATNHRHSCFEKLIFQSRFHLSYSFFLLMKRHRQIHKWISLDLI